MHVSTGESDLLQLAHRHEQTAAVERDRAHWNMAVSGHVDCFKVMHLYAPVDRRDKQGEVQVCSHLAESDEVLAKGGDGRLTGVLPLQSSVRATLCHPRLGPC